MWKNIKDKKPGKDTDYLVMLKVNKTFCIDILAYSTQSDLWTDRDYEDWSPHVTHWMFLPEFPKITQHKR